MPDRRWTPEQGAEIDRLFARALELPEEERAAFLDELRGRDAEVASGVERLLGAADTPDPRLDPERWAGRSLWGKLGGPPIPQAREGDRVGPWRILEEAGRGGMSVVYVAERADGLFDQRAALKFLHVAHDDALLRFERERRILAGLEHPNIARLLDGGTDDRGRPYLVMEYVEGQRIDTYCHATGAGLEERLKLVDAVAEAVEYAHRHLVIHRDIKPSNILVTGDGMVKLLDFGIARLLEPVEGEGPAGPGSDPVTATMMRLLTPEYASPEQVRGERITTASDIYQIGVLLYELLAGRRPYSLVGASPAEIERVVCDQDPPLPSTAGMPEGPGAGEPGAGSGPPVPRRRLRGDLDTIVLKAMARDPERRYASVRELQDDLARHRDGLPVRARRPTFGYRTARFVRRHRAWVVASVLIFLSLVAGLAATSWQAVAASRERDRAQASRVQAEAVTEFLVEVFDVADPDRSRGERVTARELLDRGAQRVGAGLGDPGVDRALMGVIGRAYRSLGLFEAAEPLLEAAVERSRAGVGDPGEELALASALAQLGRLRIDQRRLNEADSVLHRALGIRREVLGGEHAEVAEILRDLSTLRNLQGDMAAAESLAREALEMRRRLLGDEHPTVAAARTDLGRIHLFQGDREAAERELTMAVDLYRRLQPGPDRRMAASLNHLGQVRHNQGRPDEARELYREAHGILESLLGPNHPQTADVHNNLGTLLYGRGQYEEAAAVFEEVLEARRRTLDDDHPLLAHTLHNLASVHRILERFDEAEEGFRGALEIRRNVYGDRHRDVAMTRWGLAALLRDRGRVDEAEVEFRAALGAYRETLPEGHATLGAILMDFGSFLLERGLAREAEPYLEEALEIRSSLYADEDQRVVTARGFLNEAREALGRAGQLPREPD